MSTYNITSWSDLVNGGATSNGNYSSGDTVNINGSFSTDDNTKEATFDGTTVNGNNNTITFHGSRTKGLFILKNDATITSLTIDGNGQTLLTEQSLFIWKESGSQNYSFTLDKCVATNVILGNEGSGAFVAGDCASGATLTSCSGTSITTEDEYCGGLIGQDNAGMTVTNCYCHIILGDLGSPYAGYGGRYGGGIAPAKRTGTWNISQCFIKVDGDNDGAIIGRNFSGVVGYATSGTTTIQKCGVYFTNANNQYGSGGIIGHDANVGGSYTTTTNVTDCYVVGKFYQQYSSPSIGRTYKGGTTATFERFYHKHYGSGSTEVGLIYTHGNSASLTFTDCIVDAGLTHNSGSATYLRCEKGTQGMDQRLPDGTDQGQTPVNTDEFADNFSSAVWAAGTGSGKEYPTLKIFDDGINWSSGDGYVVIPIVVTGEAEEDVVAGGDPYVKPILHPGMMIKLSEVHGKYYQLLNYQHEEEKIIINTMTWGMKFKSKSNYQYTGGIKEFVDNVHSYFRYLYIHCENKHQKTIMVFDCEKMRTVSHNVNNFDHLSYHCKLPHKNFSNNDQIKLGKSAFLKRKNVFAYEGTDIEEIKIKASSQFDSIQLSVGKTRDNKCFRSYIKLDKFTPNIKKLASGLMVTHENYKPISSLLF